MPLRTPLFQRKGGAVPAPMSEASLDAGVEDGAPLTSNANTSAKGSPKASPDESAGQPHSDNVGAPEDGGALITQCPNCGCAFDVNTGEVDPTQSLDPMMGAGDPMAAGGDPMAAGGDGGMAGAAAGAGPGIEGLSAALGGGGTAGGVNARYAMGG